MRNVTRKRPATKVIRDWKKNREKAKKAIIDSNSVGRAGYVYIFKLNDEYYKVGKATNVERRRKVCLTTCYSVHIIWTARVRDTTFAEKDLHEAFKSKKIKGEMYNLKIPGDMIFADQIVNKYR